MNTSINLQLNLELKKELKKDFLLRVTHILTPILLEGLQQLYNDAKNATEDKNKVLSCFQSLLRRIPDWQFDTLNREVQRIHMKTAKQCNYFPQLLQSLYSLSLSLSGLSPEELEKYNIKFSQFIHRVYIECARFFYLDPFLFYHNYTQFEQKKNYCEIVNKINTAIEITLRELLPIQVICDKLGVPLLNSNEMETKDLYDMNLLLEKVIDVLKTPEPPVIQGVPQTGGSLDNLASINKLELDNQTGGNNDLDKNVNEQILDIMKKNNVLTESNENHFTVNNHTNENHDNHHNNHNSSSTIKRVIQDSRRQSQNTVSARQEENSEMKNKILKELDTETVQQNQEGDNYQDVYSNSDMMGKSNNSINTNEKNEKKSRDKFFNNYLNI